MTMPAFTKKPGLRRLALALPAAILFGLGVRTLMPAEALGTIVDRGPVETEIRGTGTLESVQEVPLAFKVGGRILSLPLDEGSPITRGQVLGQLEPQDLKEQLGVAQAARGVAQAGIGKAQADLAQAQAGQLRARSDFERVQRLQTQGILSRSDLDAAQERLKITEATVQAMAAVGTQAQRGETLAQGNEALQSLALQEGRLVSPVDGLLTRRLREPGNIVAAGTPVLTVVSTRKLWVRAWVDERALGSLRRGQAAMVELRSHPGRSFPGRVDRIGRQSDRQTHELLVDVEVLELPPLFAVGQRADVRIQTTSGTSVLRVPSAFLGADGALFVNRGGRALRVQPVLGQSGGGFIEIKGGVAEGEQVLRRSRPEATLSAGRRVKVKEGA